MSADTKATCIIQARVGSTRYPGKVLRLICGKSMLQRVVDRVRLSDEIGQVIVATSDLERDEAVVDECQRIGVDWFCGDEQDLLGRYIAAAEHFEVEGPIVRVTSDCPFIDPDVLSALVRLWRQDPDYLVTNNVPPTFPHGLDAEVMSLELLKRAHEHGPDEHVTTWMRANWQVSNLSAPANFSNVRLTVDTKEDMTAARAIYWAFSRNERKAFTTKDIFWLIERRPEIANLVVQSVEVVH